MHFFFIFGFLRFVNIYIAMRSNLLKPPFGSSCCSEHERSRNCRSAGRNQTPNTIELEQKKISFGKSAAEMENGKMEEHTKRRKTNKHSTPMQINLFASAEDHLVFVAFCPATGQCAQALTHHRNCCGVCRTTALIRTSPHTHTLTHTKSLLWRRRTANKSPANRKNSSPEENSLKLTNHVSIMWLPFRADRGVSFDDELGWC